MAYIFTVFTLLFMLIIEVFCVLFRLTGLSEDKARFQVTSMLTTIGFTTRESETIVNNPVRRNLAMAVMVVGYCGNATLVSFFISLYEYRYTYKDGIILAFLLVIVIICLRVKYVRRVTDTFIESVANKVLAHQKLNKYHILDDRGLFGIIEITLLVDLPILNIKLGDMDLKRDNNIQILMITRKQPVITVPSANDKLILRDKVIVFGEIQKIKSVFKLQVQPIPVMSSK